jgi:hypothetical protein
VRFYEMPTKRFRRHVRHPASPSNAQAQVKRDFLTLIDFLSVAQQLDIYFLPVGPQTGLGAIGRGLSGLVTQSTADVATSFAFRRTISPNTNQDDDLDQEFCSLITELSILHHNPIKHNAGVIDLVGVSWEVDFRTKRVWPVLVTRKSNQGDLERFLFGEDDKTDVVPEVKLKLCSYVAEALGLLHQCGKCNPSD